MMISRVGLHNVKMATTNKNNRKKNGKFAPNPAHFRQTFSNATNLPSISNMLTSDTMEDEARSKSDKNVFQENLYVTRNQFPSSKNKTPTSSSSSSPLSETVLPTQQGIRPPHKGGHKRTSSLESLMNAAEKVERTDPNFKDKIIELQNIRSLIAEHVSFLQQKCSNFSKNENILTSETDIYDTLRKLQNLSIYLHDIVSETLSSQRMKLIQSESGTVRPPNVTAEPVNIPTTPTPKSVRLQQAKLTLLPPLHIKESSKDTGKFTAFKFPDVKSPLLISEISNTTTPHKPISDLNTPKTTESDVKSKHPIITYHQPLESPQVNSLQTPKEHYSSSISPLVNDSATQSKVMVTGKLNKIGNSFTLFPKSNNQGEGKSTIITPMSHNKISFDPTRSHERNTLVIPPLHYYHEPSTITPNSSREENRIIPELEEDPSILSPANVKRAKTSPTGKILTSKTGATVGMTKTLKLTNNSLLEKPIKKAKDKDKFDNAETRLHNLEPISNTRSFENKGPIMKLQEPERVEPQQEEDESNKRCFHCQSSKTPEWRAGPYGGENICNACGLFYRKIVSKFGEKGGNLLMKYRQLVCPRNRRVPAYIEIPEEYMIKFSKESGFDQFST
ncbi:hypothetical protein MOUN0_D02894 [Monosporozyma unispora]